MAIIDKRGILHGSVSNIVYRGYRDMQIAQIKPARVKQTMDTKEAGLEFGLCSSTGRIIREAFSRVCRTYDGKMVNRMTTSIRKAVAACTFKERGDRTIHDADLSYIKGFQFNVNCPTDKALPIRPLAELTGGNHIKVSLPLITFEDIKGPIAAQHYVLRLVAVSFNFKTEMLSFNSLREIHIQSGKPFTGGEIVMDEGFADGRLVLLSMSLHAYERDGFGGMNCINTQQWSPAEIIGAWHAHGELEGPELESENIEIIKIPGYKGNECLVKIAKLREKTAKQGSTHSPQPKTDVSPPSSFILPKGDLKMRK